MAKQRKGWVYSPSSVPLATLSPTVKAELERKAKDLVENVLKPKHITPPRKNALFNYLIDIDIKWHGSWFYFVATYACPGPNALSPTFETKFARMKHVGGGRFNLAYMRHTGQWIELFAGQTIDECLKSIEEGQWFEP